MNTHTLQTAALTVRDDEGTDGRTVEGYGVRWGQVAEHTEYGREAFAPGAFASAIEGLDGRPLPMLAQHDGEPIGALVPSEDDDGLLLAGRLFDTPAAQAYAERAAAGIDGASIEFLPDTAVERDGTTIHKSVARLVAAAASYKPAYVGARLAVRDMEVSDMDATEQTAATPDGTPALAHGVTITEVEAAVHREVGELRRSMEETGGIRSTDDPYAVMRDIGNLGDLAKRIADGDTEVRGIMQRVLADNLTSESPGVMTPGVLQDVKGIVQHARPAVSSFGTETLAPTGMTVEYPYVTVDLATLVGAQSAEKAEITSVDVPILKGTASIVTYAGGGDNALQLVRRSAPSYLAAQERLYLSAYALTTEAAFVTALEAAATGAEVIVWTTADLAAMQTAALSASIKVQLATGAPAEFIIAASDTFLAIGALMTPAPIVNAMGTADARTNQVVLSGLPVLYSPNVAAGTALISNSTAASWHESGPEFIDQLDVAKLGIDKAVWGLGAAAVYTPAGVVETAVA